MKDLLTINNLKVAFETPEGVLTAVKGVSLRLDRGETLALVGESGCGKTVLCKSMLRILCERGRIEDGEIMLDNRDLVPFTEEEMQSCRGGRIAMVFQDPMTSLDPAFSVGEQIAEVIRKHKGMNRAEARKRAVELMEAVRIDDAEKRYDQRPYQFSGGMRQRIVIANALAGEPDILLADEPTTALDEETQNEILHLLRDIQKQTGTAVLFITHDLSLVEDIAERVAIMKDGYIVEEGKVSEVFAAPRHEYTRKLLGYLDYRKNRGHNHRHGAAGNKDDAGDGSCESSGKTPVLSVKNISKSFMLPGKQIHNVLEDFSMEIYEGEIVGIVGPSGCGKSTLSRCIAGLEKPEKGQIVLRTGMNMQMIFQDSQSAFNDRMTVEEIIAEPLRINRTFRNSIAGGAAEPVRGRHVRTGDLIKQEVNKAMTAVELDVSMADRRPYELSGGQRQRAAIARALVTDPDFIIADEPLTGLDVSAQAQIVHLLRKLADERNLTIMFIAHDLPMVNHISSRIIKMR